MPVQGAAVMTLSTRQSIIETGGVRPWYLAGALGMMDHLIDTCPALRKETHGAPPREGRGSIADIEDVSVCGWCRRVWKARNR